MLPRLFLNPLFFSVFLVLGVAEGGRVTVSLYLDSIYLQMVRQHCCKPDLAPLLQHRFARLLDTRVLPLQRDGPGSLSPFAHARQQLKSLKREDWFIVQMEDLPSECRQLLQLFPQAVMASLTALYDIQGPRFHFLRVPNNNVPSRNARLENSPLETAQGVRQLRLLMLHWVSSLVTPTAWFHLWDALKAYLIMWRFRLLLQPKSLISPMSVVASAVDYQVRWTLLLLRSHLGDLLEHYIRIVDQSSEGTATLPMTACSFTGLTPDASVMRPWTLLSMALRARGQSQGSTLGWGFSSVASFRQSLLDNDDRLVRHDTLLPHIVAHLLILMYTQCGLLEDELFGDDLEDGLGKSGEKSVTMGDLEGLYQELSDLTMQAGSRLLSKASPFRVLLLPGGALSVAGKDVRQLAISSVPSSPLASKFKDRNCVSFWYLSRSLELRVYLSDSVDLAAFCDQVLLPLVEGRRRLQFATLEDFRALVRRAAAPLCEAENMQKVSFTT